MIHVETFLNDLDAEYREAAEVAERAASRADALRELRSRAFTKNDELGRPPTPEEVFHSRDAEERRELQRLVALATQEV